jgi:hypothetical protein
MWEAVLEAFAACDDVDFAYPTQRFYNNLLEGKVGARARGAAPGEAGAGHSAAPGEERAADAAPE